MVGKDDCMAKIIAASKNRGEKLFICNKAVTKY